MHIYLWFCLTFLPLIWPQTLFELCRKYRVVPLPEPIANNLVCIRYARELAAYLEQEK